MRTGTSTKSAKTTSPIRMSNVARIAHPRAINLESQRTGKDSASVTAKPPRSVTGTLGANHISSKSAKSPSNSSALRVRFEILMGVGGWFACLDTVRPSRASSSRHVSVL